MNHPHHDTDVSLQACADAKAEARALREIWSSRGLDLGHSDCLELVALCHGARDWNTLSAQLRAGRAAQISTSAATLMHDRIFGLSSAAPAEITERIFGMVCRSSRMNATDMWASRANRLLGGLVSRLVELRTEGRCIELRDIRNGIALGPSRNGRPGYLDLAYPGALPATPAQRDMEAMLLTFPAFPATWHPGCHLEEKTIEHFGYLSMIFTKPIGACVDEDEEMLGIRASSSGPA